VTRDISQQELNQINRRKEFYTLQGEQGKEEAIRVYGAESKKSIYESNRVYKDRIRFLREYFKKYNEFPDLYMSHLYATFEIIKDIAVAPDLQDVFYDLSIFKTKLEKKQVAENIANYMKDKGFNSGNEYVGFRTILGTVNFSNTGDWTNAEYVIYRWINTPQNREWLSQESDTGEYKKFIGPQGDFIRLF
jgi:sulfur relay (sulfurtransferase) DsrC/TusE family protein